MRKLALHDCHKEHPKEHREIQVGSDENSTATTDEFMMQTSRFRKILGAKLRRHNESGGNWLCTVGATRKGTF